MTINVPKNDVLIERHLRSKGRSSLKSEGAGRINIIETWPINHKFPDTARIQAVKSTLQFASVASLGILRRLSLA
jgi:hypothetical protein